MVNKQEKITLDEILTASNIHSVSMKFAGSGDSGGLEDLTCKDKADTTINASDKIEEILEDIGNSVINHYASGYEIDGGGSVDITLKKTDEGDWQLVFDVTYYVEESFLSDYGNDDVMAWLKKYLENEGNKKEIKMSGMDKGNVEIFISYSGSGDSGGINEISVSIDGQRFYEGDIATEQRSFVESIAYEFLEHFEYGFEINDGGFGEINITLKDGKAEHVDAKCYRNYSESHLEYDNQELDRDKLNKLMNTPFIPNNAYELTQQFDQLEHQIGSDEFLLEQG